MPALLIDLDGTMLTSDAIHAQVFTELWQSRGLEVTDGFYMKHVHGRLNVDIFAEFLPDEPDPQGLSEWKEAQFRDRLPRPFPAMPELLELLNHAQTLGWRIACSDIGPRVRRRNARSRRAAAGCA